MRRTALGCLFLVVSSCIEGTPRTVPIGGMPMTGVDSGVHAGELRLVNPSVTTGTEDVRWCLPASNQRVVLCGGASVTFVIDNGGTQAVERLTAAALIADGQRIEVAAISGCEGGVWSIGAGEQSSVLEVALEYEADTADREERSSTGFVPALRYPCNRGQARALVPGTAMPSLPTSGDITIELSGLLEDGSAWTAAGTSAVSWAGPQVALREADRTPCLADQEAATDPPRHSGRDPILGPTSMHLTDYRV